MPGLTCMSNWWTGIYLDYSACLSFSIWIWRKLSPPSKNIFLKTIDNYNVNAMKTSNQALLLLIITTVALSISVPLILRHQLSASNFKTLHSDQSFAFERKVFRNIRFVLLKNINNATVVPDDSFKIDIEKSSAQEILMQVNNDTLEISSRDKSASQRIRIFLPESIALSSSGSSLLVRGALAMFDSLRMKINLSHSRMEIAPAFKDEKVPQYWDQLILSGSDSSSLKISGTAIVNRLEAENINELKLGDRIFIDDLVISYANKKAVRSTSDDSGLLVQGF